MPLACTNILKLANLRICGESLQHGEEVHEAIFTGLIHDPESAQWNTQCREAIRLYHPLMHGHIEDAFFSGTQPAKQQLADTVMPEFPWWIIVVLKSELHFLDLRYESRTDLLDP